MFLPKKELKRVSGRLLTLLLSAIAIGLFTSCSNTNTDSKDQKVSIPAIDTTKVSQTALITTAAATPAPTSSAPISSAPISPAPTSSATVTPLVGEPISTIAARNLPELEINELETYKRAGLLEIDVPKGWKLVDNSQPSEILITWLEKAERATICVNIFVPPSEIPENRLGDVFEVIIKGMYGNQSDFSMRSPVLEATGNIVIEWTSTVTIGDKRIKFQANSKLQRINNKFAILTFGAIDPKFAEMKDSFAKIANSQIVNPNLAIP